jgi:hypothetical protein
MSDTMQTHAPPRGRRTAWLTYAIAAVAGIAAVVFALRLQSGPPVIRSLTVRNETPFEVSIDVRPGPHEPITPLGIVGGQTTATFQSVIDEGRTWQFVLTCSGGDGGTIIRTRSDLAEAGWQLLLDTQVATACAANLPGGHQ